MPSPSFKWVTRLSSRGTPYQVVEWDLPRIDDEVLDSVVYLYPSEAEAEDGKHLGGSGFIIGVPIPFQIPEWANLLCVVTNKHVIDRGSATVRINTKDGSFEVIPLDGAEWLFHPDGDDVAICPIGLNSQRHKARFIGVGQFLTKEIVDGMKVGIGDETYFPGRFIHHEGRKQNLPSLRFGTIAQMPFEPIKQGDGFDQESFLVEARSISGYSGSPVFVNVVPGPSSALGHLPPHLREHLFKVPNMRPERFGLTIPAAWLMGVDYCHIRAREPVYNAKTGKPSEDWFTYSNTGMMGVVPAWKIRDILDGEKMMALRIHLEEIERKKRAESPVGLDAASASAPPATDANPTHQEDFRRLLGAAARKPAQED